MRRSRNHQHNQHQMSPSGPLLTSHLRDLDIELELLKRKREIIEQKQNILNREKYPTKRQYDYNTPNQYDRQESKPNIQSFNYSQYYDEPSHSGNYRPQGVKRKPESHNYSLPSKRFNAPQTINPWQTSLPQPGLSQPTQYSAPNPAPLMGLKINLGPRPQKRNRPPRKISQPSKVTKPKPHPAPNKLASYPVEKTKKLVTQAMKAIDRKPDETQILRADKSPTVQVTGRLELALGMVMKQIKQDHCSEPDDLEYFLSPFIQRLLKHTIRTRIRNVMMNQYVGAASDIVEAYRIKYPKETDIELVKVAKDAQCLSGPQLGAMQLIDADDPEEFYKKNMTKILNTKLEEMFSKLQSMYSNAGANLNEYIKKLPEPSKDKEKEPKTLTIEGICGEDGSLTSISENIAKINLYTKFMEELIEDRLPKIIPKFKNLLFSLVFSEKEFLGIKAMIAAQLKRKILKTIENDNTSLIHNKKDMSDKLEKKASVSIEMDNKQITPEVNKPSIETTKSPPETHTNEMKEDNDITKEAKENASVVNVKTELGSTEIAKPASVVTPVPVTPIKSAPTLTAQTSQTPLAKDMLYVKLIGRPVLPARAVIYDFLKKFNPASIKKHKSISNFLVLGFSDRENFDKILTANECIVGESTIIIKSSEQVNIKKQTPDLNKTIESSSANKSLTVTNTSNVNKDLDESNASNESKQDSLILNADLDSQITNLLMSIRKCEEDAGIVEGGEKIGENVPVPEASKEINDENKKSDDNIEVAVKNDTTVKSNEDKTAEKPTDTESAPLLPDANESTNIDVNKTNSQIKPSETQQSYDKTITEDSCDDSKTVVKEKKELESVKECNEDNKNKESTEKPDDKSKANAKETGCATPSRTSARLANVTPSTIRTRRASRLAQNN